MADAFSRATINFIHEGVDYEAMAASQKQNFEVQAYRIALSSLQLKDVPFGNKGNIIFCDTSTGQPRPVVPTKWTKPILHIIHGLSHPSIRATHRLIASKFVCMA